MRFERTTDYALIRAVLTDPSIWRFVGDDYAPPVEEFQPNQDERLWWVTAHAGKDLLGLFLFVPQSAVCWESHVSMLPEAWGGKALAAGIGVVPWLFERTTACRLVANIPATNRLAIKYAKAIGFLEWGINSKSFAKGGKLVDLVCLGLSRN